MVDIVHLHNNDAELRKPNNFMTKKYSFTNDDSEKLQEEENWKTLNKITTNFLSRNIHKFIL